MDRLKVMRSFVTVAELKGFTAAARRLGLAKSSVTKHVAALEAAIDTQLLVRNNRSVALTDSGERIFEECRSLLGAFSDLLQPPGSDGVMTPLHIVVRPPVSAGWVAGALARIDPGIVQRTIITVEGEGDVTLALGEEGPGALPDSVLIARLARVAVAGGSYRSPIALPVEPGTLRDHRIIGTDAAAARTVFRHGTSAVAVDLCPHIVVPGWDACLSAMIAGLGIAILPVVLVEQACASDEAMRILPDWSIDDVDLIAAISGDRAEANAFVAALRHMLARTVAI